MKLDIDSSILLFVIFLVVVIGIFIYHEFDSSNNYCYRLGRLSERVEVCQNMPQEFHQDNFFSVDLCANMEADYNMMIEHYPTCN